MLTRVQYLLPGTTSQATEGLTMNSNLIAVLVQIVAVIVFITSAFCYDAGQIVAFYALFATSLVLTLCSTYFISLGSRRF